MSSSFPASAARPFGAARRVARPLTVTNRVVWRYAVPIVFVHLLALAALLPYFFSLTGVALLVGGIYAYGALGINIGYHRLLTHRSFKCPLWWEHVLATIGVCCLEDAPGSWVATHRLHHNDADENPDPHTPRAGFFWSHMGWLLVENRDIRTAPAYERFARDVLRDPYYMRLQRTLLPLWIYFLHAAAYFLVGVFANRLAGGTWQAQLRFGGSLVVWGVLLRTVCVWHISWSVNSAAHLFGYRNYETGEDSRNSWFVALLTSGEGWHNNHHVDPASASNWHRWWEFDPMYLLILAMQRAGLASDVIRPRCQRRA
ncbi:MAG TPA: fatty acid desaturase [Pirellulales bacterium]|nr:fatty acid desaturase [Pirellulales bacterium]